MYKVILLTLLTSISYTQNQFDYIVASGQNNIAVIYHPVIEIKDTIYSFISNDYRYYYGFSESLLKLNSKGQLISNELYLDTLSPFDVFDVVNENRKIIFCGTKKIRSDGSRILMYGLLNYKMDTVWTHTIASTNNHPGLYKITRLMNSNIAMVGDDAHIRPTGGAYPNTNNPIFLMTDSIGNIIKYIHFPKPDSNNLESLDYVMQSNTGDIYCVGQIKLGTLYNKGLIIKLNENGDFVWRKEIEQFKYGYYLGFIKDLPNSNLLLIGSKYIPFFADNTQVWTCSIEINPEGSIISEKIFYSNHDSNNRKCISDKSNNIVCGGVIYHADSISARGYLIKLSSNGDSIWKREFTHGWKDRDERFFNIANADDGGYYLTGDNWVPGDNSGKAWIVKVDSNGCVVPGCNTAVNVEPQEYDVLFLLYPNPIQDNIIIYLNDETRLEKKYIFECFDQNGRMVLEKSISGMKSVIEVSFLNSGMYFYRIHDSKKVVQSGKMVKGL